MTIKAKPIAQVLGAILNAGVRIAPQTTAQAAFYLFGLPRPRRVKPQEEAFLQTAQQEYYSIGEHRIAVYRWGTSGRPVALLAHGWESHAGRWRKIGPSLVEAGYRVVAMDAPAHGRSSGWHFNMVRYADVLRFLLEREGPVHLMIGHSVGGASSIWAMGNVAPNLRPRFAVIMASFASLAHVMENGRRLIGAEPALLDAMDEFILRLSGRRIAEYDLTEVVRQLSEVKALLLHDRHDRVTHFSESERLCAAWPGARLVATEGLGHGLTAPQAVNIVLEFARQSLLA
ncbi:MAG: alpha/beta hydrolase [Saprospiraceae bacterium]|nr:alpha/beta hydrolase [Saprospiraceae bacterium]MDW8482861.1 alpha/beta fold hydrolase [Saprospiraceae bacterium]